MASQRQMFFVLNNVIGSATGSYTMLDSDGSYVFHNYHPSQLNGVTFSVGMTQATFQLTNYDVVGAYNSYLLLHFDTTGSLAIDSSAYSIGMTAVGGATMSINAPKFGSGCFKTNVGTSFKMMTPNPNNPIGLTLSKSSWMMDFWVKNDLSDQGNSVACTTIDGQQEVFFYKGQGTSFLNWTTATRSGGSPTLFIITPLTFSAGVWVHVAYGRNYGKGTSRMDDWLVFFNGVRQDNTYGITHGNNWGVTSTDSTWDFGVLAVPQYSIGPVGSHFWSGQVPPLYIDEFRFVYGSCPWTANFTPPTAPYS